MDRKLKSTKSQAHHGKKNKLRTSKDVYNRLKWDWKGLGIDLGSVFIGYKDRFLGMCELAYSDFHPGSEDEWDIPFHRIYYFRGGGPPIFPHLGLKGEIQVREHNWPPGAITYWDRDSRFDLIFKSGEAYKAYDYHEKSPTLPSSISNMVPPDGYKSHPSYKYNPSSDSWDISIDNGDDEVQSTPPNLTILTFNILYGIYDEDVVQCASRWPYLIDYLEDSNADLIALQEVTLPFLTLLEAQPFVRANYYLTEVSSNSESSTVIPYGQILMSKFPPEIVLAKREMNSSGKDRIEFGKIFLIAKYCLPNGRSLYVANIHLSSDYRKDCSAVRQMQMKNLVDAMLKLPDASGCDMLILGDTNCRNGESILGSSSGFVDAWEYLGADGVGYTVDTTENELARANSKRVSRERLDRIFFKGPDSRTGSVGIEPIVMEIGGKEPIDFKKAPRAITNLEVKVILTSAQKLWLSDHYALKAEFKIPATVEDTEENSVGLNYSLTYTSTLAIIPPEDVWSGIQSIRSEFDPAYIRWPPHINLLYPFVEDEERNFELAEEAFNKVLKDFPSFNVTFKDIAVFQHSKTCTVYLKCNEEDESVISALQSILFLEFQTVFRLESKSSQSFKPHLTLAKLSTGSERERERCKELIQTWRQEFASAPIVFRMDSIKLMSRTAEDPFDILKSVNLKNSPKYVEENSNETSTDCEGYLNEFLCGNGLLQTSSENQAKRTEILNEIETICSKILNVGTFSNCTHQIGSTAMGFQGEDSDLDILCCGPPSITQQEFFAALESHDFEPFNLRLHNIVKSALVPVARLCSGKIQIDLTYCRLPLNIPPHLIPDAYLDMMSETDQRALDGLRIVGKFKEIIPPRNQAAYRTSVRSLKYWAKHRSIYSKIFGFIGSLHISVLVAHTILQMLNSEMNDLSSEQILKCFFEIFSKWRWPQAVTCRDFQEIASTTTAPKKVHVKGKIPELMPILSPVFPHLNTVRGATRSTLSILQSEFERGHQIFSALGDFDAQWKTLIQDPKFTEEYPKYLYISVCFEDEFDMEVGMGILSSKLVSLVVQLEKLNSSGVVRPNPNIHNDRNCQENKTTSFTSAIVFGLLGYDGGSVSQTQFDQVLSEQRGKMRNLLGGSCQYPVVITMEIVGKDCSELLPFCSNQ